MQRVRFNRDRAFAAFDLRWGRGEEKMENRGSKLFRFSKEVMPQGRVLNWDRSGKGFMFFGLIVLFRRCSSILDLIRRR